MNNMDVYKIAEIFYWVIMLILTIALLGLVAVLIIN